MPSVDAHCLMSKERTGKEYRKLHEWIDAPNKELGYNHRIERHSDNEVYRKYIKKRWDEKAVIEWLFHIAVDNFETAYKSSFKVYKKPFNYYKIGFTYDELLIDIGKYSDKKTLKTV